MSGIFASRFQFVSLQVYSCHCNHTAYDSTHSSVCLHQVDVLTVEIEHVDVEALETAAAEFNLDVEPTPHTLRLIQVLTPKRILRPCIPH